MRKYLRALLRQETLPYLAIIAIGVLVASLLHASQTCHYFVNAGPNLETDSSLFGISPEGWTAVFTGLLTISTAGLWIVTHTAANAAKAAAEAASKQAEVELPFVYTGAISGDIRNQLQAFVLYDNSPVAPISPEIAFRVKNYGRTSAILRSVSAEFVHWTEIPQEVPSDVLTEYAVEPILEPSKESNSAFKRNPLIPIDRNAFNSIMAGTSRLFLYGEIIYADVFGGEFAQAFCLTWNRGSNRFVPWGARYNLRKRN